MYLGRLGWRESNGCLVLIAARRGFVMRNGQERICAAMGSLLARAPVLTTSGRGRYLRNWPAKLVGCSMGSAYGDAADIGGRLFARIP